MIREFYIVSDSGDEYSLSLSSDGLNFSEEIRRDFGLELISIELMRIKGSGVTSTITLKTIEEQIAGTFEEFPESILFYYCDFLNPVPTNRQGLSPQEYRSRLFSLMFQRYITHNNILNVSDVLVTIEGEDDQYFIHMIARQQHLFIVQQLGERLRKDFEK